MFLNGSGLRLGFNFDILKSRKSKFLEDYLESLPSKFFLKSSVLSFHKGARNLPESVVDLAKVGDGGPGRGEEGNDLLPYLVRKIRHLNS